MAEPHASTQPLDAQRHRTIRSATTVLLSLGLFMALSRLLVPTVMWPWGWSTVAVTGVASVFYAVAYWQNEKYHHTIAGRILMVGIIIGSIGIVVTPGALDPQSGYAAILNNVLVTAFVLSWRAGAVVAFADAAMLAWMAAIHTAYGEQGFVQDLTLLAIISTLTLLFAANSEYNRRRSREAQAELNDNISDISALLDNCPDALLTLARDGTIIRRNGVAQAMAKQYFGATADTGASLADVFGPEGWGTIESMNKDFATVESVSRDVKLELQGKEEWFQIYLRQIDHPDGRMVAQIRNITEARHQEMRERTAYRDRIDLQKLKEIDQFRTRLLNMASHEMRTPMTPLRLQLGVLERRMADVMDDRTKQSFETIKRNVSRLNMLLDDLLDVSKLQAQELHLKLEPLQVDEMVRNECEVYRALAEAKGLRLEVKASTGAQVKADPHRLAQVFSNLLSNAIKYASKTIQVKASRGDAEIMVEVRDDGAGFAPDQRHGLWEPFRQIQEGEDQKDGTGLGLYICKGIVENHGGRIWASSAGPGRGASFSFALPLHTSLKYEGEAMTSHE